MSLNYPDIAKSERKDALVPDPQEYDMSDPNGIEIKSKSEKDRCELFSRLTRSGARLQMVNARLAAR